MGWIYATLGIRRCGCQTGRYLLRQLGARFAGASFDRLIDDVKRLGRTPHPSLVRASERIRAHPGGSYYLHGDYGAWKTYLAACQFRELVTRTSEQLCAIRFYTEHDLARTLRDIEMERATAAPVRASDILSGTIKHLFIDDLGKRRVTDFVRDEYLAIINAIFRVSPNVGLTITSNSTLEDLAYNSAGQEVYDPGMARRIHDLCESLEIRQCE